MTTRYLKEDSIEYIIACAYASGKGRIFEMFFGWRKTDKNGMAKVILSHKGWQTVDEMVEYYHRYNEK